MEQTPEYNNIKEGILTMNEFILFMFLFFDHCTLLKSQQYWQRELIDN